jgi:hypothetical protein
VVGVGGVEDDRQGGVEAAEEAGGFQAAGVGHAFVDDEGVDAAVVVACVDEGWEGLAAVGGGGGHGDAVVGQEFGERVEQVGVVVDEDDAGGCEHGAPLVHR